jgi:hypothetical protein
MVQVDITASVIAPGSRSCLLLKGYDESGSKNMIAFLALSSDSHIDEPPNGGGGGGDDGDTNFGSSLCYIRQSLAPLDYDRMRSWIRFCDEGHSLCKLDRSLRIPGLPILRLIDVVTKHLVEVSDAPPYFALSYVWGAVPNFRLTTANKPRLLRPGAFDEAWELLPLTIRDAITLTKGLGGRYLWVDSLCLLQNQEADLDQGVRVMDHIFEQSELTIVGACGHNANAGLVGLLYGDRKEEDLVIEVRPGVYMGAYYSLDSYLRHSVYETRAWT